MMGKTAVGTTRPATSRQLTIIGLAAALVIVVVAGYAGAPYLFKRSTLQNEIATQVRATLGFTFTADHERFNLFPHPHVSMSGVHVADPSGSVRLEAERMNGQVRLLPLIVGRVELSAATLQKPRLTIDLDGRSMPAASTIGRALHSGEPGRGAPDQRLGAITFVDGSLDLIRGTKRVWAPVSNLNVTIDWRDLDSSATVTGAMQVLHTAADVSAWVAEPSKLMRGDHSAVVLRVHSTPLDLSANGSLASAATTDFKGRVTASAPSLAAVLALVTPETTLPAPFANMTLDSTATVRLGRDGMGSIDLQDLDFRADGNAYEGTIAYLGGPRPLISGTLAANRLVLAPFVSRAPTLVDPNRKWTDTPLPPLGLGSVDLDMRFSAAHLRVAPYNIDDAALSVMTRGDRLEIGLNEGKAYGGAAKGRMSFGRDADGLNIRAAGTLTGADLGTLSWDALGRQVATGTLSGSANLEATGTSVATLAANLQGWIKGRASEGEVFGVDLGRDLRDAAQTPPRAPGSQPRGGSTAYSDMLLDLHVANGLAAIDEASMRGPSAATALTGAADVGARALDLRATVTSPKATNASAPALLLDLQGGFDKVLAVPDGSARSGTGAP